MSNERCEMHGVHSEQIKMIIDRLEKTEQKTDKNITDIQRLKENKASNDEKFERVFELLGDLKTSINEIVEAMKVKNERLPNAIYGVGGSVFGGVSVGVIVWLITK